MTPMAASKFSVTTQSLQWLFYSRGRPFSCIKLYDIAYELQTGIVLQSEKRLRMELDGLDCKMTVANAHNYPVLGFSSDLEAGGELLTNSVQRVVPPDLDRIG